MVSGWQVGTLLFAFGSIGTLLLSIWLTLIYLFVGIAPYFLEILIAPLVGEISFIFDEPAIILAALSIVFSIISLVKRYEWDTSIAICVICIIISGVVIIGAVILIIVDFPRFVIAQFYYF